MPRQRGRDGAPIASAEAAAEGAASPAADRVSPTSDDFERISVVRGQPVHEDSELPGYDLTPTRDSADDIAVLLATPRSALRRLIERDAGGQAASVAVEIDVVAYLGTDDAGAADRVLSAIDALVEVLGYDGPYNVEVRSGSVFRRARAVVKRGADAVDVQTRLAKVERALELAYLDRRQADVDAIEAGAVRQLVDGIKDLPQACIRVGSILLVKFEDTRGPVLLVRTLSPLEVHALERFPEIQTNPRMALEALATAVITLQPADES